MSLFLKNLVGNECGEMLEDMGGSWKKISAKDLWTNMRNSLDPSTKAMTAMYKDERTKAGAAFFLSRRIPLKPMPGKPPGVVVDSTIKRGNTAGTIFGQKEKVAGFYFEKLCMIRTNCGSGKESELLNTVKNIVKNIIKHELGEAKIENFDEKWNEIIQQLYKTTNSAGGLIEEILDNAHINEHLTKWIPTTKNMGPTGTKVAEVLPDPGTEFNATKIQILKDIFIQASSLIRDRFDINIAFYTDFELIKEDVLYNKENSEGNIHLIYYQIDLDDAKQPTRKIIDPIWFINIETGQTFRSLLENSAVAQHFKTKYKMDASDSSKTEESTRVRNSPIYFNPMDKDANLPVILINGKEYLLGFPKDNDYRNLYLAAENHDLAGELNFHERQPGDGRCDIWWCEQAQ